MNATWTIRLARWWDRLWCKHRYVRPVLIDGKDAGEICFYCDREFRMTDAEFYAKHGERYLGMLKGARRSGKP